MDFNQRDLAWAHLVGRVGLGVNIAMHGWSRMPKFAAFASHLQEQFAATVLPASLVHFSAVAIVTAEATIGLLLLLGLWTRFALVAGGVLMWTLLFGTCLVQNWTVAGDQLIYVGFFAVLLATAQYNRFSVDGWTVMMNEKRAKIVGFKTK